ncbi:putative reverse transcriptase domain-containing protein [Tanacetum coccineum]|uniref:Reverse transcriptase domain-containing protein n=1 Tax=Tanacetum coccineum TaxID=301880 RepID=A0ABQ5HIH9_9ASTR
MSDRTDSFLKFIEDVITKKIVYHLFDDEVEFLGCVFLSYLLALEITCSCFHDFIDKDLIDLVLPDVRRFIEGFSKIAKSLTELTQKNKKYSWGKDQESAFQQLKQKLCEAPILALPKGDDDFVVYCDASL